MTGPDSDNELDDFLARRSLMHRRFAEGDQREPPAELDRIVLAKAREAIKRPSETPVYRSPQWALPVGLAASLLLVFAVVLNFAHVTNKQAPQIAATELAEPEAPPAAASARERLAQAERPAPATSAFSDAKTEAYAPAPPALARNDARSMMKRSAEVRTRVEQQAKASALAGDVRAQKRDADASGAALPPGLTVEARAKDDFVASTDKPAEIDATRGLAGNLTGVIPNSAADVARSGAVSPAAAPPAAEPAQPDSSGATSDSNLLASNASPRPTVDEPSRSDEAKDADESVATMASSTSLDSARRVRGGGKRAAAPNAPTAVEMEKRKHPDPDAWLREIDELRTAGRVEDADRELAMFRRTYPDHSTQTPAEPSPPAK
jgi:hypothetical protein